MASQIPEPRIPIGSPPPLPALPPPKGAQPPAGPGAGLDLRAKTLAEQGRPLPLAYGTVKLPALVVEQFPPEAISYPPWQALTTYYSTDRRTNGGNVYEVITTGVAAGSGGPTGTGSDITDGTVHWKYLQAEPMPVYLQMFLAALCEGEISRVLRLWWDKEVITSTPPALPGKGLELKYGVDSADQLLPLSFDQSGYQHTALIHPLSGATCYTGTQKELPEMAVEIESVMLGSTTPDVSPADIVNDLLTHSRRGAALDAGIVDASITGTAAGSFRTYCDALGLRLSLYLDRQVSVLAVLDQVLAATNSDAVWSQGKLKVVPLGDEATTTPVYGAMNYVPATGAVANLGVADFLDTDQPVSMQCRSDTDCFNGCPVEYVDRSQDYTTSVVEDPDQLDIEDRGLRRAPTTSLGVVFPDGTPAVMLSRILAQRSLQCRNTYTFRLPAWKWLLLEPTDIVTLTEPGIGLDLTPVRIVELSDDGEAITVTAEDFPAGVAAAGGYAPQLGDGLSPNYVRTTAARPNVVSSTTTPIEAGTILTEHVADLAVTTDKIADDAVTVGKIAADQLRTTNYAEDGSGNPTAGAKLDHTGTALKVAPANLQVGKVTIGNAWFGNTSCAGIQQLGWGGTGGADLGHFGDVILDVQPNWTASAVNDNADPVNLPQVLAYSIRLRTSTAKALGKPMVPVIELINSTSWSVHPIVCRWGLKATYSYLDLQLLKYADSTVFTWNQMGVVNILQVFILFYGADPFLG